MTLRDVLPLVAMTLVSVSWLFAGLVLNALQLLSLLVLRPVSRSAHREAMYILTYCMWAPLVAIAEHGAGFRVRLWFSDPESESHFGREHMIAIANHTVEVDWLLLWLAIDKYGALASAKAMVKKVIRTFPIMGWTYLLNEFVFLERNWDRDQDTLRAGMDNFLTFNRPVTVLMFCEGTRFTPDKFAAAQKFAASKGLEAFKHHLMPRSRGFECCVSHLNQMKSDKLTALYNVQIAVPHDSPDPTFLSLLRGLPVRGDVFLQRIPIRSIAAGQEQQFLMKLYRGKDDLMTYYKEHGRFPEPAVCRELGPRLLPLVHLVLWCGSVSAAITYLLLASLVRGQTLVFGSLSALLLLVFVGLLFLIRSTRAHAGSSYGSSSPSSRPHSD